MKKILILGTGAPQADLIRACKEREWTVFSCSYRIGDPGEQYADHFEQINITDQCAVMDYAVRNKVDMIYSAGSDVAMPTVFSVSEKLGLPAFCKAETAVICNTKSMLREKLGTAFEGNIPYQTVQNQEDPVTIPYPLMIKPVDSQGQRGVFRVNSHQEYLQKFSESKAHSRRGALILESFIDGEEISVNTFSVNGKLVFFLPSDRVVWDGYSGGLIRKHILPGKWAESPEALPAIRDLVNRTLRKLEIRNGPAYFQIMMDNQGIPHLIEVTPRLDGCHMWRLIRYSTGVDLMRMTVDALDGKEPAGIEYTVRPYVTEFFCLAPDTVFSREQFDFRPCDYLEWYYTDGDIVRRMNGYKEKCGYCIYRNDSAE